MLQACAARPLLQASALRALSCCAAAAEELAAAKPGTVSGPYDQHILLQLPRPVDAVRAPGVPGAWWPQLVEREPAVVEAFREVARRGDVIGKVKITAFEEVARRDEGPPPGACNLLAFPAGVHHLGARGAWPCSYRCPLISNCLKGRGWLPACLQGCSLTASPWSRLGWRWRWQPQTNPTSCR